MLFSVFGIASASTTEFFVFLQYSKSNTCARI